eukprot:152034-Amphidinium_carterae.1
MAFVGNVTLPNLSGGTIVSVAEVIICRVVVPLRQATAGANGDGNQVQCQGNPTTVLVEAL